MKYLSTLAFCLSTSVASAQTCKGEDLVVIPEMEAAKDAFFKGNYEEFVDLLGVDIPNFPESALSAFAPLDTLVKGAYDSCYTIIQRHESPGFYQDVVLYYSDQIDGPISLLFVGADFGGRFRLLEFTYDTKMSNLLQKIH